MTITLDSSVSRRIYLRGDTFSRKDSIRAIGGHWDATRKAWWVGVNKRTEAEAIASQTAAPAAPAASADRKGDGEATVVAGRGAYRGRTYYIVGRTVRGRTQWDDGVAAVQTGDGLKVLLAFRDGSKTFWAIRAYVQITKIYDRPQTVGRLARFAADAKSGVSHADYLAEIEGAEDMDSFTDARRLESIGYAGWKAEQAGGAA